MSKVKVPDVLMRSSSKPLRKIVGGVTPGLPALCQVVDLRAQVLMLTHDRPAQRRRWWPWGA